MEITVVTTAFLLGSVVMLVLALTNRVIQHEHDLNGIKEWMKQREDNT